MYRLDWCILGYYHRYRAIVENPWRCEGVGREGLKRDFDNKLVFHGGVGNQHTFHVWKEKRMYWGRTRE